MVRLRYVTVTAALMAAPQALSAQEAQDAASQKGIIMADVAVPWVHAGSGISVPARIGSFARGTIQQTGEKQLDIVVGFEAPDSHTTLTVYIFRAWLPTAPVWFDRIDAAMHSPQSGERLGGTLDAGPIITAFAPPGQTGATALRSAYAVTGKRVKATGSAVIPAGDWLVTMRMSSLTMDKAQLDATIASAASALGIPKPKRESEPAQPVAACADAMPLKAAKRAKAEIMDSLLAGILTSVGKDDAPATGETKSAETAKPEDQSKSKPVVWCRDSSSVTAYGVYRNAAGGMPGYTIAFGDAGIAADVQPSIAGLVLQKKDMRIGVELHMLDRDYVFAPFTAMPTPEQVYAVVQNDQPIGSSDRSGNVSISMPK